MLLLGQLENWFRITDTYQQLTHCNEFKNTILDTLITTVYETEFINASTKTMMI